VDNLCEEVPEVSEDVVDQVHRYFGVSETTGSSNRASL